LGDFSRFVRFGEMSSRLGFGMMYGVEIRP